MTARRHTTVMWVMLAIIIAIIIGVLTQVAAQMGVGVML